LNFAGFSQDTIAVTDAVFEPPPIIRTDPQPTIGKPQPLPKNKSFSLPKIPKEKNPKVASWLSTLLPGAGQVYNGHWYKVPVIYGGAAALWYSHNVYATERDIFQKEYRGRLNPQDTTFIPNRDLAGYSTDQILSARDYYRRNIEWIYIFSGLLYLLNIIDASVFAHLSTFDVSDNLSLRVQPFASPDLTPYAVNQQLPMQGGLRLTFTLK
jgi:hypothetical protein